MNEDGGSMKIAEKYGLLIDEIPNDYSNPVEIYRKDIFTKRGRNRSISDAIANKLLDEKNSIKDVLKSINKVTRKNSYKMDGHDADYKSKSVRRNEEIIAMWLCSRSASENIGFDRIGRFLDYQIPMNDSKADKHGKIDLLSYNSEENSVFLIELKHPNNAESINKAMLEIATYYQIIDHNKLLKDMGLPLDAKIRKMALASKDSTNISDFSKIKEELAKSLEVEIWTYEIEDIHIKKAKELEKENFSASRFF